MELRCDRELAMWLGAIAVESVAHHKELKDAGHLMVRDPVTMGPVMFWPWTSEHVARLWKHK